MCANQIRPCRMNSCKRCARESCFFTAAVPYRSATYILQLSQFRCLPWHIRQKHERPDLRRLGGPERTRGRSFTEQGRRGTQPVTRWGGEAWCRWWRRPDQYSWVTRRGPPRSVDVALDHWVIGDAQFFDDLSHRWRRRAPGCDPCYLLIMCWFIIVLYETNNSRRAVNWCT